MSRLLPVALAGALAAGGLIGEMAVRAAEQGHVGGEPFVRTIEGSTRTIDVMLSWGDGQAFDAIARDPTLSHPEAFREGAPELAYRAQRPLLPYLAWLLALGNPAWTGWAFVGLLIVGGAAATTVASVFVPGRAWLGVAIVLLPGALASLNQTSGELPALALSLAGIRLWYATPRRPKGAGILFALSILVRETAFLVPLGIVVHEIVLRRRPKRAALLFTVVPWLTWTGVIVAATGVSPLAGAPGRLSAPFSGLARAAQQWSATSIVVVVVLAAFVLDGVLRRPRHPFTTVALVHAAASLVMGVQVWGGWEHFSRALLPMSALALLVSLSRVSGASEKEHFHVAEAPDRARA